MKLVPTLLSLSLALSAVTPSLAQTTKAAPKAYSVKEKPAITVSHIMIRNSVLIVDSDDSTAVLGDGNTVVDVDVAWTGQKSPAEALSGNSYNGLTSKMR